jgi:hypothetical protein
MIALCDFVFVQIFDAITRRNKVLQEIIFPFVRDTFP